MIVLPPSPPLEYRLSGPLNSPLELLVRKLESLHPMSDHDRQSVLGLACKQRMVEAQAYLLREGDRPERCAVLLSGYAFRHKLTGDGARQILSLHIPGEGVDFQNLFLGEADHNVQMLTRGEIAEVTRQSLQDLIAECPNVGHAILMTTQVEASIFREWTLNIGRRDARTRIAHLLCELAVRLSAQRNQGEGGYELPVTQEQLADATGLTAVHVNRVLRSLQAEGLIERDRRVIRFPSWAQMRDVGDFNPRYLHFRNGIANLKN